MSDPEVQRHSSSQLRTTSRYRCTSKQTSPSTVSGLEADGTTYFLSSAKFINDTASEAQGHGEGEKAGLEAVQEWLWPFQRSWMGSMLYVVWEV